MPRATYLLTSSPPMSKAGGCTQGSFVHAGYTIARGGPENPGQRREPDPRFLEQEKTGWVASSPSPRRMGYIQTAAAVQVGGGGWAP